jgi:hypothetical protein
MGHANAVVQMQMQCMAPVTDSNAKRAPMDLDAILLHVSSAPAQRSLSRHPIRMHDSGMAMLDGDRNPWDRITRKRSRLKIKKKRLRTNASLCR